MRAGGATRTVEVGTIESPEEPGRPIVGIQVEQSADIELPGEVDIDLGGVGGPSAGLAFALDVVEELRGNVDRGLRVAATGELELDGRVSPGRGHQTEGDRRPTFRAPMSSSSRLGITRRKPAATQGIFA